MKFKRIRGVRSGGAWLFVDRGARCTVRSRYTPGLRDDFLGFRCCFSPFFVIKRKVKNES